MPVTVSGYYKEPHWSQTDMSWTLFRSSNGMHRLGPFRCQGSDLGYAPHFKPPGTSVFAEGEVRHQTSIF